MPAETIAAMRDDDWRSLTSDQMLEAVADNLTE
jgi:hypothetical protein